jgi:hypothetical protein
MPRTAHSGATARSRHFVAAYSLLACMRYVYVAGVPRTSQTAFPGRVWRARRLAAFLRKEPAHRRTGRLGRVAYFSQLGLRLL